MENANNPNEIVCNILFIMTPEDKHIQGVVLVKDGFDPDAYMMAEVIRLRCTQDNADCMARGFLNSAMADIGDDFIVDLIEAEGEFQGIPTSLMAELKSKVAVSH